MKKNSLEKLKIYVAGHNGMVGKAVVKKLKTIGVQKLVTASRKKLNLLDLNKLKKFIKLNKPDVIINCAEIGRAHVRTPVTA